MNDKIKAAIEAGEAKKRADDTQKAKAEAELRARQAVWEAEQYDAAQKWAEIDLPSEIQILTAKGERTLYLGEDKFRARAAELAGLTVERSYHEAGCDDGWSWNSHWTYRVKW